jgi:hypothetical protein
MLAEDLHFTSEEQTVTEAAEFAPWDRLNHDAPSLANMLSMPVHVFAFLASQ